MEQNETKTKIYSAKVKLEAKHRHSESTRLRRLDNMGKSRHERSYRGRGKNEDWEGSEGEMR
eukprot:760499-Hanusia_phi.AAC.3